MSRLLTEDFLLTNDIARQLYHDYAKDLPIIDFHNHLPPDDIAKNHSFKTITDIWLEGDHYKWRLMRANGIDEHYITGEASKREKFQAWAETVPHTLGNPLFHWTQMELKNYFGIDDVLSPETAENIWNETNDALQSEQMTTQQLLLNSRVEFVGTTDDPTDTLEHHKAMSDQGVPIKVAPSFRPDKGLNIDQPEFSDWVQTLSETTSRDLSSYMQFLEALSDRIEHFDVHGCKAADHGIGKMFFADATEEQAKAIYAKRMNHQPLTAMEVEQFKTYTMRYLAACYHEKGWVMQLHIGALRNNNTKMFERIGRDAGYDSLGDALLAEPLSRLLDAIEYKDSLPKTILYCLNPRDNYILATMAGNFQGGGIPGKVQFGTAWWFNDHIDGMEEQMKILANVGLIKHFIGMLTDSRSFLSFSRHEYFRRILCNLFGNWAEKGKVPADVDWLATYVKDISYGNARRYFNLYV
ncbi:glucuronate isomerase [Bacillaceae bacterium SIJ1]|uniref:glucuronate isomerase n=1 Tax=Litoribacterium kuwaitense TaxID=1398745 RepID=UPI0013EB92AE|nr:glucuronate isomerase [Litoribacterium kuwaitense]NGP45115.1 glucuronate isomerase [Litoribacterium kuwaitense]